MRSRTFPPLLAAALLAVSACAGGDIPVSANYDPLVRFPSRATFAWDDAASVLPDDPAVDRTAAVALLKEVANEVFAEHGYRAVANDEPANYRLSYQYTVHTYLGPDVSKAQGSLSLLLEDNASRRRVWAGFGRAEIHAGLSPEARRARLRDALERMLKDFPPAGR